MTVRKNARLIMKTPIPWESKCAGRSRHAAIHSRKIGVRRRKSFGDSLSVLLDRLAARGTRGSPDGALARRQLTDLARRIRAVGGELARDRVHHEGPGLHAPRA